MSGHLNPGGQQFRGDRGTADPRVAAALAAYLAGRGTEQDALSALAAARLLVPVIAVLAAGSAPPRGAGSAPPGGAGSTSPGPDRTASPGPDRTASPRGDKDSEMMLPTLIGRDGRPAVLAFTCLDALARWRKDARPVPAEADRVWRAAVADGCAVVIDVAGPVPLAVEGARLAALAAGLPAPPPHEDPDVRAEVEAAVASEPAIARFSLASGRAGGPDLAVTLELAARDRGQRDRGQRDARQRDREQRDRELAVNRAAAGIAARLGGRLRRGIEIIVAG